MNDNNLQALNATAHLPVSEAYLLPRYPIAPSRAEPAFESLGRAYGQAALTLFVAILMSVLFVYGIARLSGEPANWHAAHARAAAMTEQTAAPAVAAPTPAVR